MVLVGIFNENDLKEGKDKIEVEKKKNETGYNYTKTELVKKGSKIIGIKIFVCDVQNI